MKQAPSKFQNKNSILLEIKVLIFKRVSQNISPVAKYVMQSFKSFSIYKSILTNSGF